jgi:hypothetical protein
MLMKEELAQKIILGKKTQTRRPIKDGDMMSDKPEHLSTKTVIDINGRVKYQVGREYSIQYGRGLPTRLWHQESQVREGKDFLKIAELMRWNRLRIKLVDIWAEDVRTINYGSSLAEGFSCADEFLVTWSNFYDATLHAKWWGLFDVMVASWHFNGQSWSSAKLENFQANITPFSQWLIHNRPTYQYHAWALVFELVK